MKQSYIAPDIGIVDVAVEAGFTISGESTVGHYDDETGENEDY